jgi:uncharacterized membrane protein YqgA involved in biofilm formation
MIGTLLNAFTVAIGTGLGLLVGDRLSERIQQSVVTGLGLVTLTVGMDNALQTGNVIIPLLSIGSGVIIGELLDLDARLKALGGWLQKRFGGDEDTANDTPPQAEEPADDPRARFINGFVTASLVFCVGPLTFLGSIQDGMTGNYELLAIKSVLDGFAAMAFASAMGIGVAFSIVTILVLQGGLALLGAVAGDVMSAAMITEMTATGGMILIGLALILLDVKQPRMANFLPALVIAPLIVALGMALGIPIYPL